MESYVSYARAIFLVFSTIALCSCATEVSIERGMDAFDAGNYGEAIRNLRPFAEQGDVDSQYDLAEIYEGVRDYRRSLFWYEKAAGNGDARAAYEAGNMYRLGLGTPPNMLVAIRWWKLAGQAGELNAAISLAHVYAAGEVVPRDPAEAMRWNLLAADGGDPNAQFTVGKAYAQGYLLEMDLILAYKWLEISASTFNWDHTRHFRDYVEARLSPDELAKAEDLVREWKSKNSRK